MDKQKLLNVLHYYYETSTLKEVERSGWIYWNVSRNKRIESVPEHIYGTQNLAIAIYSEFDLDIDIFKVITMLSLHETEEIHIGDKTPFDKFTKEDKQKFGKLAVDKTFNNLSKKKMFIDIIDEFNRHETPEAIFAYFCDKMECDLQAKKYLDEKRLSFETAPENVMNDKRVKNIIANGAKNAADVFINNDEQKYQGNDIFLGMAEFLKNYDTSLNKNELNDYKKLEKEDNK